ncbi:primosomal protein DnaI [Virgibacillus soli]|uniref:Primosomal protein DnaI n=1 Tax=Paracerasibacillus soli TaxID=480284 RepID=A0ABU5CQH7_9BACI|nr:primosomal protein DnaI [Virgibacillus soli]MDY0408637.1 primosomal protein DnaI [Virgibacillus soli]
MEPLQSALKKWMKTNKNFKENYESLKQDILQDPEIKQILLQNPQLDHQDIEKNLMKFYEYINQSKQCDRCKSLGACINILPGYSPILQIDEKEIRLAYEKCHFHVLADKEQAQQKLIDSLYMPKEILQATYEGIDLDDPKRKNAIAEINQFISQLGNGLPERGLYFYGPFGVGKTYFLGAIANTLKSFNISSMIIYMPELVREMRSSIKDDSLSEKINYFKKADVLMLDDIGAEMQSAWFRDEVLGSILQYRMMEKLPTFFTSNYSLEQLAGLLATTKNGIEEVKAGRIIERIKQLSHEVSIMSKNRRE